MSIWIGVSGPGTVDPQVDILQDLCGVGHYDLDQQEILIEETPKPVIELAAGLSYSKSFLKALERSSKDQRGHWIVAQYDFAYEPARVKRAIADDPRFLGTFRYRGRE